VLRVACSAAIAAIIAVPPNVRFHSTQQSWTAPTQVDIPATIFGSAPLVGKKQGVAAERIWEKYLISAIVIVIFAR
jgi:hypothetical protein